MKAPVYLFLLFLLVAAPLKAKGTEGNSSPPSGRKWAYFEPYLRGSYSRFGLQGGIGFAAYRGELSSYHHWSAQKFHLGHLSLGASFRVTNYISLRAEASYYQVGSRPVYYQNDPRIGREDSLIRPFTSRNGEWHISLVHDLFSKKDVEFHAQRWNPYVFVGIGQTFFNPIDRETKEPLRPQENNGGYHYASIATIFPVGIGINYYLKDYISIGFEVGYRFTQTYFLDDFKDPAVDDRGRELAVYDQYLLYGLKLNYQFLPIGYKYKNYLRTGH